MRQCANFAPEHTGIRGTGRGLADSKFQIPNSKVWSLEFGIRHPPGLELGAWSVLRSS